MKANYLLNFSFPKNPIESPKKKKQFTAQFDKNVFMNAKYLFNAHLLVFSG